MDLGLVDKVAVVTGAGGAIGRAIALRLAAEGATVVANGRREENIRQTVDEVVRLGGKARAIRADVSSLAEVKAMAEEIIDDLGRIDLLVNNAGVNTYTPFFDLTEEIWDQIVRINLTGVFLCSQVISREMVRLGTPGKIINISSISGDRVTDMGMYVHYCASKAAVSMLSQAMAVVLGPHEIRVNAVLPGTIETDINRENLTNPETRARVLGHTPLGTFGKPEDVADLVAFLASDRADWITGSRVVVDGGYSVL